MPKALTSQITYCSPHCLLYNLLTNDKLYLLCRPIPGKSQGIVCADDLYPEFINLVSPSISKQYRYFSPCLAGIFLSIWT